MCNIYRLVSGAPTDLILKTMWVSLVSVTRLALFLAVEEMQGQRDGMWAGHLSVHEVQVLGTSIFPVSVML